MEGTDDHRSYRDFVEAHGQALLRAAYVLTGDTHRAEDLVQTVFVKLVTRWWRVEQAGNPLAYARTVLYREFCSWWRVRANREQPHEELPEVAEKDFADATVVRLVLRRAVLALPPRQRALITLRFFEDRTEAEAAEILGCAVGTVKSQTHKALRRLREQMPELAYLPEGGPRS